MISDDVDDLSFLKNQIEEAKGSIEEAIKSAEVRKLFGTSIELKIARGYLTGVLFEMERKQQHEFAPFRR